MLKLFVCKNFYFSHLRKINLSFPFIFVLFWIYLVLNFWQGTSALSFAKSSPCVHKNYISTLVLSPEHEAQNPMFCYFPNSWYSRKILSNYNFFPKILNSKFLRNHLVKRGYSCMERKTIECLEFLRHLDRSHLWWAWLLFLPEREPTVVRIKWDQLCD